MTALSRRGLVAGAGAAGVLGLTGCSSDPAAPDKAAVDETAVGGQPRTPRRIIWAVDGVEGLSSIEIDRRHDSPVNTPSVTHQGRLRVTSSNTSSAGNHRQAWLIRGTEGFTDGEIRTIWWPPSIMDSTTATPQMGLVARLTPTEGIVADQNITFGEYGETMLAAWSWSKGGTGRRSRRGSARGAFIATAGRAPRIGAVLRTSGPSAESVYYVDRTYDIHSGDHVVVDGCGSESFNGTFEVTAVVPKANAVFPWPAVICASPGEGAVPLTMTIGRIRLPHSDTMIDPRSIYPFHIAMRVVGSRVTVKKWQVGDVEPTWTGEPSAATVDTAGGRVPAPPEGGIGVMTNHLRNGAWVEFDDLEIVRYR